MTNGAVLMAPLVSQNDTSFRFRFTKTRVPAHSLNSKDNSRLIAVNDISILNDYLVDSLNNKDIISEGRIHKASL